MKDLTLGKRVILSVASALQEICWGTSNRNFTSAAKHFSREFRVAGFSSERDCELTAARELSGRPVIVHHQEVKLQQCEILQEAGR